MLDLFGILNGFNFDVEINGALVGFKSVGGIKLTAAFEPLRVGGLNDGPVMLPVPVKEGGRITFERGKYKTGLVKLPNPGDTLEDMTVLLYDDDELYRAEYNLQSPVVESLEVGRLDAMSSELVIETLTVVCRNITGKSYL